MSLHLIELNDSDIRIRNTEAVLGSSPGFANIAKSVPVFGEEALHQSRLHPRQNFNQFWSQLSLDPLVNSNNHFRHQADLAYAHLNSLAVSHNINDEVIFAVPSNYNQEQLAILLGLANQLPFKTVGLVDLAILNLASIHTHQQALFVDIQLHQTVLTVIETNNGQLIKGSALQIPGTGLLALHDAWANMITDEFINQSRFDPQHNADTEQYVYSQLKQWLADTLAGNELLLEINNKGSIHQATVNLAYFEQRSRNIFKRIKEEAQTLISPNASLYLPAAMANLPGLKLILPQCISIENSILGANCFAQLEHIKKAPDSLSLVTKLPINTALNSVNHKPSEPAPTHILLNHEAYALPASTLYLGARKLDTDEEGKGVLKIDLNDSALPKLLSIARRAQELILQYEADNKLCLNGKPVNEDSPLKLGDCISIESSDTLIQLIQVR